MSANSAEKTNEFVEGWRKKAFDIPDGRTSAVITRSFDALKSMNGTDFTDLAYRAEEMKTARENAFKFDNHIASDPERRFFYGISQSIEATCETLIARFKQEEMHKQNKAQMAQAAAVAKAAAEERAKARAQAQAEAAARAQTQRSSMLHPPVPLTSTPLFADVKVEEQPDDEVGMGIKEEELDSFDNGLQPFDINDFGPPGVRVSQLQDGPEVVELSDDEDITMNTTTNSFNTNSFDIYTYTPPIRKRGLSVKSLSCHRCTAANMNISAFVKHLTDLHKTTPVKEKLAFHCACSFIGTNYTEVRKHALFCHNIISIIPRAM